MFVVCICKLIHTKEKKIWMDGDGYHGKDTRPHTGQSRCCRGTIRNRCKVELGVFQILLEEQVGNL
jgi:hypothetical protein